MNEFDLQILARGIIALSESEQQRYRKYITGEESDDFYRGLLSGLMTFAEGDSVKFAAVLAHWMITERGIAS